jgi:tRNA threonylcarbamoyl adenosine modification protein YeaZ
MRILYIDTSSSFLYTAIISNGSILAEIKEKMDNRLSANTLPRIEEMFYVKNITIDSVDKIVAVNGPGSFTGIRIGLTIAKTLAWAKKIPIIPISSLEAMALSYDGDYNYVIPAIDARRNNLYASIYDTQNKQFVMKEQHISMDTLNVALLNLSGKISFVSNDNLNTDYDIQQYEPKIDLIVKEVENREPINPHAVDANYLKLTEAEENKLKEDKND